MKKGVAIAFAGAGTLLLGFLAFHKKPVHGEADISLSDLTINPQMANPGDTIEIEITVTNSGDAAGVYNIIVGGDIMASSQTVNVPAGESVRAQFSVVAPTSPGTYNITVGPLSGQLVVTAAPVANISASDLLISPNAVHPGENVTVSLVLTNTGNAPGSVDLVLTLGS